MVAAKSWHDGERVVLPPLIHQRGRDGSLETDRQGWKGNVMTVTGIVEPAARQRKSV